MVLREGSTATSDPKLSAVQLAGLTARLELGPAAAGYGEDQRRTRKVSANATSPACSTPPTSMQAPIVLICDALSAHKSVPMRTLIAAPPQVRP
jgi:hypothetical protein